MFFFPNVVHSIRCLNLLLLIMNHTMRLESSYEVASCCMIYIQLVLRYKEDHNSIDMSLKKYYSRNLNMIDLKLNK